MNQTRPFLNKFIKQKQFQISHISHSLNMKQIKPINSKLMKHTDTIVINNSKRDKMKEIRDIEIGRQNKILLEKIASTMNKKTAYFTPNGKRFRAKINSSLNHIFRKKQEEHITSQNKKMLSRLQNRKATLDIQKLKKQWQDNKSVMKRMQHFEFYLTTHKSKDIYVKPKVSSENIMRNKIESCKVNKIETIDGQKMMIKMEFNHQLFKIIADTLNNTNLKTIQIAKEQALVFIHEQCNGKMENLISKLRYDLQKDTLYINSDILEEDHDQFTQTNPQVKNDNQQNQKQFRQTKKKRNKNFQVKKIFDKRKETIEPISQQRQNSTNKSSKIGSNFLQVAKQEKQQLVPQEKKQQLSETKVTKQMESMNIRTD